MTLLQRLRVDDEGQDLVEYVLLGSLIAFAGFAVMQVLPGIMHDVYVSWDNAQQDLWYPAPPGP